MALRSIWRGHLRLALVSCPVALYNARHDRAGIRFNLINPETGNRTRMITQDAETGKELERRDLVKGYEFRKNQYVLLNDEDSDSVKIESSSVMLSGIKTDPEMVELAAQLMQRQSGKYDASDLEDRYETWLRAMIEAKLKGEGIDTSGPAEPARTNVVDLMAALKKSLAQEAKPVPTKKAAAA